LLLLLLPDALLLRLLTLPNDFLALLDCALLFQLSLSQLNALLFDLLLLALLSKTNLLLALLLLCSSLLLFSLALLLGLRTPLLPDLLLLFSLLLLCLLLLRSLLLTLLLLCLAGLLPFGSLLILPLLLLLPLLLTRVPSFLTSPLGIGHSARSEQRYSADCGRHSRSLKIINFHCFLPSKSLDP
jgi:hypothetical protein